jgi:hypothetical protein
MTEPPSRELAVTNRISPLGRTETKIFSLRKLLNTPSIASLSEESPLLKSNMESNWMNSAEKRLFSVRLKVDPELKEFLFPLILKLTSASLPPLPRTLKTLKSLLLKIEQSNILPTEMPLLTLLSLTTSRPPTRTHIVPRASEDLPLILSPTPEDFPHV